MEEFDEYQVPETKKLSFDFSRVEIVKKNLNPRQAALKQFCDRIHDKALTDQTIAMMMSHMTVEEINEAYHYMDKHARNFTAYWKWCYMPKKR